MIDLLRFPRAVAGAVLAMALLIPSTAMAAAPPSNPPADTRFYPQTGHSVSFGFKRFFDTRGGLDLFGYPTTEEIKEAGWTVQYFQRARFEYHPEFAGTPYEVELGLLGDLTAQQTGLSFSKAGPASGARFYPQTSHNLSGPFLTYFDSRGGLDIFGYPTSEPFQRAGFTVQYFQRSRLELHGSDIMLGLLGDEYVSQRATQPATGLALAPIPQTPALGPQPTVRVAVLGAAPNPAAGGVATVNATANGPFAVFDTSGRQLMSLQGGQQASVSSSGPGSYTLSANGQTVASALPIRLAPSPGVFMHSMDLPAIQQDYRGVLETDFSSKTNKLWLIDELGIEDYVKGIGEEPEGLPPEVYKTFAVAYRTYALSTQQRHQSDPNWKEPFDLGSSTDAVAPYNGANQIYTGQHRETLGPLLTQGEQATAGQVVTYNGSIAVTPYFSHSDGRTRSWEEVWHGSDHPWLVSVPDPDGAGQTLLGHGVGMPLRSAVARAAAGWSYDQILRYFYTGVQITKAY